MIKLVVIDLDDTLVMTEGIAFQFENYILKLMGYPPMSRDMHLKTWGKTLKEGIEMRIPGIDGNAFVTKFEEELPQLNADNKNVDAISERNLAALDKLKQDGLHIAILTSRTEASVVHLIDKKHPLSQHVDRYYHLGNSFYAKPDPRVFEQILKDFNLNPEEAVYIGDQPSDATCAKGAGLHFIAVLESGLRTKEDFTDIKVDAFVDTFDQVEEYIREHRK